MTDPTFKEVARTLAVPRSRRRVLAGLIGAGLGLAVRSPIAAADCPILSQCWLRQRLNPWSGDAGDPAAPDAADVAPEAGTGPVTEGGTTEGVQPPDRCWRCATAMTAGRTPNRCRSPGLPNARAV